MHAPIQQQALSEAAYVSTGSLPPSEFVIDLIAEAHKRFQSNTAGRNSDIYPALARVPSQLFGVCVHIGTIGHDRRLPTHWARGVRLIAIVHGHDLKRCVLKLIGVAAVVPRNSQYGMGKL